MKATGQKFSQALVMTHNEEIARIAGHRPYQGRLDRDAERIAGSKKKARILFHAAMQFYGMIEKPVEVMQ